MELLCLMGLYPKEYENELLNNTIAGMQNAANKFQWGIVNGIIENSSVNVRVINSMFIGSYPRRYKKVHIPTFSFKINESDNVNVGFTNFTGYKVASRYFSVKKEIDKWLEEIEGKEAGVIAYAMTSPFVELLSYIKKKAPNVKCCLVVPDLPEYMNASASQKIVYKVLKKIQIRHFKRKLMNADGFVLLTKYMEEWFDWEIKYVVIEGISLKTENDLSDDSIKNKRKCILYAGMIEEKYGLLDLVKAFHSIDNPEWELELYGSGTALDEIKRIAATDKRIVIKGIASNQTVLEAQKECEIVINPRNDSFDFTKYSFPSKVIEYLGSGTAMIGYILPGMPEEYYDKFYVIPKEKDGMKECMEKVMALSSEERSRKGRAAAEFIVREKNAIAQGEKILDFIKSL